MIRTTFERIKEHSADNLGKGTKESKIQKLESSLGIKLPEQYRQFLLEIGYAELLGDEFASIYSVPDELPCAGLHWVNQSNELLEKGLIRFFSNDIDGVFYIDQQTGKVYLNSEDFLYANSFVEFCNKLLDS